MRQNNGVRCAYYTKFSGTCYSSLNVANYVKYCIYIRNTKFATITFFSTFQQVTER